MMLHDIIQRCYAISTQAANESGVYRVSYALRATRQPTASGKAKRSHELAAIVNVPDEAVRWEKQPAIPEISSAEFEADALRRAATIDGWLTLLNSLIGSVEGWARELGWSPRRIEKPMEDSEVGKYAAPALLLQEETTKVLLEPIARSAPGAEGVVDIYLMPGYDDIASLYFYNNRWNLHYMSAEQKAIARVREAESRPFTKASLKRVLEEMMANAQ